MPNRILREGILTSDRVNTLSPQAEVFYRRLMSVVDDFGRFDARPVMLRVSCFPLRVNEVREADISRLIAECVTAGLIALYAVNDKQYLEMLDFRQQVRAKQSKFPISPHAKQMRSTCAAHAHLDGDVDGDGDGDGDGSRKRATRFPEPWEIPEPWIAFALQNQKNWHRPHVLQVAASFADYWRSKGETRADWLATWRNWVRRDKSTPTVPTVVRVAL